MASWLDFLKWNHHIIQSLNRPMNYFNHSMTWPKSLSRQLITYLQSCISFVLLARQNHQYIISYDMIYYYDITGHVSHREASVGSITFWGWVLRVKEKERSMFVPIVGLHILLHIRTSSKHCNAQNQFGQHLAGDLKNSSSEFLISVKILDMK